MYFVVNSRRSFLIHRSAFCDVSQKVYIVSSSKVLDWIQNPQTVDNIKNFTPWQCTDPAPNVCNESNATVNIFNMLL